MEEARLQRVPRSRSTSRLPAFVRVDYMISLLPLAVRFTGHLHELGITATLNADVTDEIPYVQIECYEHEIDKINFALYLTEQWMDSDAGLSRSGSDSP